MRWPWHPYVSAARTAQAALQQCVVCSAVALAFHAQMVEEVPMAENDRGVDVIVTADGPTAVSAAGAAAVGT